MYSFSTENWSRPQAEVQGLMAMFSHRIAGETPELDREGVRMRFIGRREGVAPSLVEQMEWAEGVTAGEHAHHALRRLQLRRARRDPRRGRAATTAAARRPSAQCLYAPEMHDPDLIIRTSGERRLSNYLLWQSAYSELVFRDELWPDFSRQALEESLAEYAARRRRFGRWRADGSETSGRSSPPAARRRPGRPRGRAVDAAAGTERGRQRADRRAQTPARAACSDLSARVLVAIPAIAVALFLVLEGGLDVHARAVRARRRSACTSCMRCTAARIPCGSPASSRSPALLAAAQYGDQFQVLLVAVARAADAVRADARSRRIRASAAWR